MKIKKIDTHIHGRYSSDSVLTYRQLCQKAIRCDYQTIAFTEHYDLIYSELTQYGLLPIKFYFQELEELKNEFPQLEIIIGIELGEPHLVGDLAEKIFQDYMPEYIIGSLHVMKSKKNVSLFTYKPLSDKDIKQYYEENLEMVQIGGFDTLGHLGIYKRGLNTEFKYDESHVYHIIDEIFKVMIQNNICLEVNNSGFKEIFSNHIPDPEILKRYKNLGGELITISSDSHDIEQFDKFYNKTLDNLKELGFSDIYWKNSNVWKRKRFI